MVRLFSEKTIARSSVLVLLLALFSNFGSTGAFSMPTAPKTIYGVPNSGWTSPEWNWGWAVGTGHDCAAICRNKYASREARSDLIADLIGGDPTTTDMEEVKLVMALKWQRNYRSGYGDVLDTMADARRYEDGTNGKSLLLKDMVERFPLLRPTKEDEAAMDALAETDDVESALRTCSGLVLKVMGFVDGW